MRSFGLIGYPLAHSFSAEWFAEMFRREGSRDAVYANYPLGSIEELPALLAEHPLLGFNVTAPYKRAIMDYLDQIDPTAERIGAVNCAVRQGDTWKGYNVDWIGFAESLMALIGGECPHALILGSGGAAAAAAYGLDELGMVHATVSRSKKGAGILSYEALTSELLQKYRLLINATPLGTWPATERFPAIPYEWLTPAHMLYDMVYNPPETAFLRKGREAGASTMNGRHMLEIQARETWKLFLSACH